LERGIILGLKTFFFGIESDCANNIPAENIIKQMNKNLLITWVEGANVLELLLTKVNNALKGISIKWRFANYIGCFLFDFLLIIFIFYCKILRR